MVKDAEANAEADRKFEEVVTARNTLEGLIHATKKTAQEAGDKATADEKSNIEAALKDAEEAVKGNDKDKIDAATQKLTEASQSLAQKLYAEQANEANAQPGGGKAEAKAEEGVVDAEFEEVKDDRK
jgi:molecular chaperone DnaK